MNFDESNYSVEIGDPELFNYSFIYMTGHGNVDFTHSEADNLLNILFVVVFYT